MHDDNEGGDFELRMREHNLNVPIDGLTPVEIIVGDDDEDTALLRNMALSATKYLESFDWCVSIVSCFFAKGIGGIFAVFLFRIVPANASIDEWLWVVDGDLPSAYLPLQDAKSAAEVFHLYVAGMTRWVAYARSGQRQMPEDVPPLNYPANLEWADSVEHRVNSLQSILGTVFSEG
jgi:hypothetical protein